VVELDAPDREPRTLDLEGGAPAALAVTRSHTTLRTLVGDSDGRRLWLLGGGADGGMELLATYEVPGDEQLVDVGLSAAPFRGGSATSCAGHPLTGRARRRYCR